MGTGAFAGRTDESDCLPEASGGFPGPFQKVELSAVAALLADGTKLDRRLKEVSHFELFLSRTSSSAPPGTSSNF